jgi:hypothetical protein
MAKAPRFRGEDFRGKWSLGSWAENHIIKAINDTEEFRALPYGKSEVGPTLKEEQLTYWEEHLGRESYGKRPDVLVFNREVYEKLLAEVGEQLLSTLPERTEAEIEHIVELALLGIESEASIWQGERMDHYGRDWHNPTGRSKPLKDVKNWTAPTVIVKDQDLQPLIDWQSVKKKPIYIVHLFYDLAFMLSFEKLLQYIADGTVKGENFNYGMASKIIYQTYYGLTSVFGEFTELAEVQPFVYQTKGGKFLADLIFNGGNLVISEDTVQEWLSIG